MEKKVTWELLLTPPSGSELLGISQSICTQHSMWPCTSPGHVAILSHEQGHCEPKGPSQLRVSSFGNNRGAGSFSSTALRQHHLQDYFHSPIMPSVQGTKPDHRQGRVPTSSNHPWKQLMPSLALLPTSEVPQRQHSSVLSIDIYSS